MLNRSCDVALWVLKKICRLPFKRNSQMHANIIFQGWKHREISTNYALEDRWPKTPHRVITQLKWANWTICPPASVATSLTFLSQMSIRQELALTCLDVSGNRQLKIYSSSFNPCSYYNDTRACWKVTGPMS